MGSLYVDHQRSMAFNNYKNVQLVNYKNIVEVNCMDVGVWKFVGMSYPPLAKVLKRLVETYGFCGIMVRSAAATGVNTITPYSIQRL